MLAHFAGAGIGAWMLLSFGAAAPLALMIPLVAGATALFTLHGASEEGVD